MILMIAHIVVVPKMYEVNTIDFADEDNASLQLRNNLYGIKGCGETMVWELSKDCSKRIGAILHCKRYASERAMIRGHKKVVSKLIDGDTSFFNGDGFPSVGGNPLTPNEALYISAQISLERLEAMEID